MGVPRFATKNKRNMAILNRNIDLKRMREDAGLKQKQIAEVLGITQPDASRRERLKRVSDADYALLRNAFGEEYISIYTDIAEKGIEESNRHELNKREQTIRILTERIEQLERQNERLLSILEQLTVRKD